MNLNTCVLTGVSVDPNSVHSAMQISGLSFDSTVAAAIVDGHSVVGGYGVVAVGIIDSADSAVGSSTWRRHEASGSNRNKSIDVCLICQRAAMCLNSHHPSLIPWDLVVLLHRPWLPAVTLCILVARVSLQGG